MFQDIDNEVLLQTIFENSYNFILITDANLDLPGPKIVYANHAFLKNSGYALEELQNTTPRILQGEETDRRVLNDLKEKCKKGEHFVGGTVNYRKDGSKYHVQWNITPIKNKEGKITHYISVQQNVSELVETMDTLQKIIDLQKNIIVITDGLKLSYVNQSFKTFFNVSSKEEFFIHDSCICSRFLPVEGFYSLTKDDENWIDELQKLSSEKRIVSMQKNDSTHRGFFVGIENFDDNKFIITFTDITESIGEKLTLKHKAYHDKLSDAYNREFIHDHFVSYKSDVEKKNLRLGLILFDIDHFKNVNDTYGHNIGDMVIQEIVKIAKETTRSSDYVIRWGGEEFVILTQAKVVEQIQTIAEHVRVAIENHFFEPVPQVTASFGFVLGVADDTLESLVKKADDALYTAKNTGRNKVINFDFI